MESKQITFLRELFATTANHSFFFALIFFAFSNSVLSMRARDVLIWILLGFIPSVLYYFRQKSARILPMILSHAAVLLGVTALSVLSNGLLSFYLFVAIAYVLLSVAHFLSNSKNPTKMLPLYITFPVIFLLPVYNSFRGETVFFFPYCLTMILHSALYFLAFYMDKYLYFTKVNEETASSMPRDKILSSGLRVSGIAVLFLSGILTLISLITVPDRLYQSLWAHIKMRLRQWIRFLANLLRFRVGDLSSNDTPDPLPPMGEVTTAAEPSRFWMLLENITMILIAMLLIAMAVSLLYRLVRYLLHWWKTPQIAVEDASAEDIHEALAPKKKAPRATDPESGVLSVTMRIRRLLKRKIMAEIDEPKIRRTTTAREFADSQNNPVMADIYERARYSEFGCDKQDLRNMQLVCRRKKRND